MNLKFCSCRMCKAGRKYKRAQAMIIGVKRKARRRVKRQLKAGDFDRIVPAVSVPYTD